MKLQGNGKGREVLVTLNVERETGRIYRTDRLRQQFSHEQAPQSDPQLGSRYLIADMEAEQLMESAGLGPGGVPPGGELMVPVRGDLQETAKPGSYRLDSDSIQPGQPMTVDTRANEDRLTSRAKELDAQGRRMTLEEFRGIVAEMDGGAGQPQATQSSAGSPRSLGPNSQAGLASHRSGIPFNGPIAPPPPPQTAQTEPAEKAPGEPRKPRKRELPIPGAGLAKGALDAPRLTDKDTVVSASVKGFVTGFQGEMLRQRARERDAANRQPLEVIVEVDPKTAEQEVQGEPQDVEQVATPEPQRAEQATPAEPQSPEQVAEERLQRFPELRDDTVPRSQGERQPDPTSQDRPDLDSGPSR